MYDVLHAKGAYYASVHSTRVFSGGRRRLRTSRRFTLMDAWEHPFVAGGERQGENAVAMQADVLKGKWFFYRLESRLGGGAATAGFLTRTRGLRTRNKGEEVMRVGEITQRAAALNFRGRIAASRRELQGWLNSRRECCGLFALITDPCII